jgi:hypothetical protein
MTALLCAPIHSVAAQVPEGPAATVLAFFHANRRRCPPRLRPLSSEWGQVVGFSATEQTAHCMPPDASKTLQAWASGLASDAVPLMP